MTNKLFIGSLPYDATDAQLSEHFAKSGTVLSAKVITDRYTGQGKGFGFVEMTTPEEAQNAIKELNNSNFSGRTIIVNEAKPQERRENNNNSNNNYRGGGQDRNKNYQSRGKKW